jgi:pyridoxal phosphate enzyme (YggS family)
MTTFDVDTIYQNYHRVLEGVGENALKSGRDPDKINLVVVTKGHPLQAVRNAIDAGIRTFGENYVQEATEKILACSGFHDLDWHMIGHIQSRKAKSVCEFFSWVQSLDSMKLAKRLDRFAGEMGRKLPVLLECNVSGEQAKFGWPAWDDDRRDNLISEIKRIIYLPHLDIRGLMTMPPLFSAPEQVRPFFIRLRSLRDRLAEIYPLVDWYELSMGMSADYTIALQEGATIIRVGTAIMGPRT